MVHCVILGLEPPSKEDNKLPLSGLFSAKLRKCQVSWLPCEIEALSIGTAVHYNPYLVRSFWPCCVLLDINSCVMADKLCREHFLSSPLDIPFYQVVHRYQFQHVMLLVQPSRLPTSHSEMLPSAKKPPAKFVLLSHDQWNQLFVYFTSVSDIRHNATIHHKICMVNQAAREPRPKEKVCVYTPGNMHLSQSNKHKSNQMLPKCRNHSIWWIVCCQAKRTICASQRAHNNPKISTSWTSYIRSFTALSSQCETDEDCYKTWKWTKPLIVYK